MEIGQLREEIDAIDKEMLSLFERRMQVSTGIAEYKRKNNLPFYDGKRDQLIILKYNDIVEIRDLLQEQAKKQTGIWLDEEEPFWIYAKCSECGSVHDAKSQYCPTCGCLMEYEEETE